MKGTGTVTPAKVLCELIRFKGIGREDVFPLLSVPVMASWFCVESAFHNKTRHVGSYDALPNK